MSQWRSCVVVTQLGKAVTTVLNGWLPSHEGLDALSLAPVLVVGTNAKCFPSVVSVVEIYEIYMY